MFAPRPTHLPSFPISWPSQVTGRVYLAGGERGLSDSIDVQSPRGVLPRGLVLTPGCTRSLCGQLSPRPLVQPCIREGSERQGGGTKCRVRSSISKGARPSSLCLAAGVWRWVAEVAQGHLCTCLKPTLVVWHGPHCSLAPSTVVLSTKFTPLTTESPSRRFTAHCRNHFQVHSSETFSTLTLCSRHHHHLQNFPSSQSEPLSP